LANKRSSRRRCETAYLQMMPSNTNSTRTAGAVLPFYAFGVVSFLVLTIAMLFSSNAFIGHYFSPKLLAITHIATLGWASMIIFGSLHQLLPILLDNALHSMVYAKITFYSFAIGIIVLVYSFWTFSLGIPLQLAAVLLLSGATILFLNIVFTARNTGKPAIHAVFIITAAGWFWLTVFLGTLMTFNFTYSFLPSEQLFYLRIHAHIGMAGWFILLIIGVSSKLIPMFLLSPAMDTKKLYYSYFIINGALLAFLVDALIFNETHRGGIYFSLAIIGIAIYVFTVIKSFKSRVRKALDIGMKQTFLAVFFVFLPIVFGWISTSNLFPVSPFLMQITLVYGASFFMGFISLLILGQSFKTLPYIIWLDKYQNMSGKKGTPLPKDLFSEKLLRYQMVVFIIGYILLLSGIISSLVLLITIANSILIIAAILYVINIFKMFVHKPAHATIT